MAIEHPTPGGLALVGIVAIIPKRPIGSGRSILNQRLYLDDLMAKKKKLTAAKKVAIVGLVLIAVQVLYLFAFGQRAKPLTMTEAINRAVSERADIGDARKVQMKVQLALNDFMVKNKGKLPANLNELVPTYFDVVPLDPATNKPFRYVVDGNKYILGEEKEAQPTPIPGEIGQDGLSPEQKQSALIASLTQPSQSDFIYDPTGKRDPFRPFNVQPKPDDVTKTPLERYELGQLKLTAILAGFDEPTAIVENSEGKGFTVKKGTKIGPNNGSVVEILKDKIMILESEIDFTGETKNRTVELKLRTKDQE